jgi:hypothetical protein
VITTVFDLFKESPTPLEPQSLTAVISLVRISDRQQEASRDCLLEVFNASNAPPALIDNLNICILKLSQQVNGQIPRHSVHWPADIGVVLSAGHEALRYVAVVA